MPAPPHLAVSCLLSFVSPPPSNVYFIEVRWVYKRALRPYDIQFNPIQFHSIPFNRHHLIFRVKEEQHEVEARQKGTTDRGVHRHVLSHVVCSLRSGHR